MNSQLVNWIKNYSFDLLNHPIPGEQNPRRLACCFSGCINCVQSSDPGKSVRHVEKRGRSKYVMDWYIEHRYIYIYTYMYMYIYISRERERCIYIYVYKGSIWMDMFGLDRDFAGCDISFDLFGRSLAAQIITWHFKVPYGGFHGHGGTPSHHPFIVAFSMKEAIHL